MDIVTIFLNLVLYKEIYIKVPKSYKPNRNQYNGTSASGGKLYCRLNKCLYGLKQAPREWYQDIDAYLISIGLTCSKEDPNIYISQEANIILLL